MIEGLADGTVDAIATDHAPHHADEKQVEFDRAPFGIVGLETCVPLAFDRLVHPGRITLARAIELLSVNPARILRRPGGSLAPGSMADITVLAPDTTVTVVPAALRSKSKNTPFDGLDAARRDSGDDRWRPDRVRIQTWPRTLAGGVTCIRADRQN